ncbi:hypothetical protein QTP88_025749 [Uroleucon formosanum]
METHAILESMNYRYTTNDNEQFIFVNNSVSSIIGFSTERNLNVLCDVTYIYMDGTFNVCPKFFTQLFTIHGLKDDVYIPLVFFLLPDKQKITYELAFKYLVDHCSLHCMTLAPVQVFIDFGIAIHMAVESAWPTSQIRGCRFHLAQSWWRKIQNLGFSAIYKDTSSENEIGNFLELFFGLPFLRPIEVIDCFTDELMAVRPTGDNRIEEFMDYVFDNYISPEASFPPSIWAQFSTTLNRTTNSCESFHSKLNSCFYSGHPNIFVFINELLEVQSETYIKCRSNGTKKSKKQQEKQIFLREEMSRTLLIDEVQTVRRTTRGVPQGSVLGPSIWNIFHDDLLDTDMPPGVQLVALTDDVAVIGISRTGPSAAELLNFGLETVNHWKRDNGLTIAPQKSKAVVLTRKYKQIRQPAIVRRWTRHPGQASHQAATESAKAIGHLMPNVGGPAQAKRALLRSVTNSKLLYASPTWTTVGTKTAKNRNEMARAQRTTVIRTIRSYPTVSAKVSSVLSSMLPADLLAHERARVKERQTSESELKTEQTIKLEERKISIRSWQSRWDRTAAIPDAVGRRLTHRLLSDIARWLAKPPLNLTFHLTQVFSGHGCFTS